MFSNIRQTNSFFLEHDLQVRLHWENFRLLGISTKLNITVRY